MSIDEPCKTKTHLQGDCKVSQHIVNTKNHKLLSAVAPRPHIYKNKQTNH